MLHPDPAQRVGIEEVLASPWLQGYKGEAAAAAAAAATTRAGDAVKGLAEENFDTAFGTEYQRQSGESVDDSTSVCLSDTEDGGQELRQEEEERKRSLRLDEQERVEGKEEKKEEEASSPRETSSNLDQLERQEEEKEEETSSSKQGEEEASSPKHNLLLTARKVPAGRSQTMSDPESPTSVLAVVQVSPLAVRKTCSMGALQ